MSWARGRGRTGAGAVYDLDLWVVDDNDVRRGGVHDPGRRLSENGFLVQVASYQGPAPIGNEHHMDDGHVRDDVYGRVIHGFVRGARDRDVVLPALRA